MLIKSVNVMLQTLLGEHLVTEIDAGEGPSGYRVLAESTPGKGTD